MIANSMITILGKKKKSENLVSDFTPEESDKIILNLAASLSTALPEELEHEHFYDEKRLNQIKIAAKDGSVKGKIIYLPVDPFGEQHAEIRVVLKVSPDENHSAIHKAIGKHEFAVAMSE